MGGTFAARVLLTVLGAASMIVGAFLSWFASEQVPPGAGTDGTSMDWSIFFSTEDPFGAAFFTSAGLVAIVLGILALLGLALRTGWLTRVAGVLAIVAIVLYTISLYRVEDAGFGIGELGLGAWLVLVGGILALIGGFMGTRSVVTRTATAPPPPAA
jgi:hypothetical protein